MSLVTLERFCSVLLTILVAVVRGLSAPTLCLSDSLMCEFVWLRRSTADGISDTSPGYIDDDGSLVVSNALQQRS